MTLIHRPSRFLAKMHIVLLVVMYRRIGSEIKYKNTSYIVLIPLTPENTILHCAINLNILFYHRCKGSILLYIKLTVLFLTVTQTVLLERLVLGTRTSNGKSKEFSI